MLKRFRLPVLALSLCFAASAAFAQTPAWEPAPGHLTLPLWLNGAPGASTATGPEVDTNTAKDPLVAGRPIIRLGNVSTPTITLYRPTSGISTGAAVVVFPGGGYRILAIDLEGTEVCDWLNSIGVTCVLLKYRVPDSGPWPKSSAALQDAQRAVGMVREHAVEWGIDPHRVGVLGFSAGAHLAAAVSTHYDKRLYPDVDAADRQSCRPDFAVVIYPGYLAIADRNYAPNPDIHPTADTPPTFLVQAEDDPVHVENSLVYFQQLKNAGTPAEMHLYTHGGHGYGLRPNGLPVTTWPKEAEKWMNTLHMLNGPTPAPPAAK
ncbi:alpha/beta hydrolase [Paracidobacterium acidisoli]|uniref:Alpha/beta hydrolase n=1 Tax=Paracidobacterium acidisoli TaxID=2303751 RepID=A0A372IJJ2_9BACT|nr:alpha/beta hydrolase [Paracidobacterium acidisoli]MBT9333268.1 alpha/beta hydrolase [Paracidobacterium acidisoli]